MTQMVLCWGISIKGEREVEREMKRESARERDERERERERSAGPCIAPISLPCMAGQSELNGDH